MLPLIICIAIAHIIDKILIVRENLCDLFYNYVAMYILGTHISNCNIRT